MSIESSAAKRNRVRIAYSKRTRLAHFPARSLLARNFLSDCRQRLTVQQPCREREDRVSST